MRWPQALPLHRWPPASARGARLGVYLHNQLVGVAVIGIAALWAWKRAGGQTWTPGFASSEQQGNPLPAPPDATFYTGYQEALKALDKRSKLGGRLRGSQQKHDQYTGAAFGF